MKNSRKITWFTQFSYGCGNLLGSGPLAITSAWLLIYLTTVCQLDPVKAGTIVGLPTLLDVILNPVRVSLLITSTRQLSVVSLVVVDSSSC